MSASGEMLTEEQIAVAKAALQEKEALLQTRLDRIKNNMRSGFHPDSSERATEMENAEVQDALGNEARRELTLVRKALHRIADGTYGLCVDCEEPIEPARLKAYPHAGHCLRCAGRHETVHR
ncbi:MAG: TraR/DksA family transcriptional regulator [Gammaproteobacteria bacterium]|jgi:DnaK suppressor protein